MRALPLSLVKKGIMRCQHTNPFCPEDVQSLAIFIGYFGADIDQKELEIPESYYEKESQAFSSEDEALAWLRNQ